VSILSKASQYHHGNLKVDLINAALALLDEGGLEQVGIRQVARAVGVAHSAPANHFRNKQALYSALAQHAFSELVQALDQVLIDGMALEESIQAFNQCMLAFALKHPNRYTLMWRKDLLDDQDPALLDAMEQVYQKLLSLLASHAQAQQVDVESQAIALWSMIHGYISLRLDGNLSDGQDAVTGKDRATALGDVLLHGLLA
jgi:AcrR family transcriptional regulator